MRSIRAWLAASAAVFFFLFTATAVAQTFTHAVYLDLDSNAATGCNVTTAAGPVNGAEVRLSATVSGQPPMVTAVTRESCGAGVFGSAQAQAAGYPVGLNNGTAGSDVVEFATALTGLGSGGGARLIFVSSSATGADLVEVSGVVLPGPNVAPSQLQIIPATGWLALILLVGIVLWLARKHPGFGSSVALLLLLGAGVVWAANFITDGQVGDWVGVSPRALDPSNDTSQGSIDVVAVFAETEAGALFVRVDVRDAQNQAPTANPQAATATEDGGGVTITLTGSDPEGATLIFAIATTPTRGTLSAITPVNATSANVTYTPSPNQNGADSFTFTVSDGSSTSAPATVSITITAVNDAPVVNAQALTVVENSPNGTVVGTATATDVDTGQTLTWSITLGNTGGAFAINPATGQITVATTGAVVPANSPFSLTVQATDNGVPVQSGSNTITITVTGVNDEPSFTAGPSQSVNEDAPAQNVPNWATAISAGPPDEAGQTLTFTANNDNNALFAVQPAVNAAGTLTYTLAANANGVANVGVFLMDNGGTAGGGDDTSPTQNFTITVTLVNDAPSFTAGPTQNVLQDAPAQTVPAWATAISAGPANESGQTLTFNITNNTNPALFSAGPAIAADGTLTYTPLAGAVGTANITLVLVDNGGVLNGGVDTSAPQTFTINVNNLNDAPTFTLGGNPPASLEDGGAQTVNAFATAIDDGDPPVTQTLTFNVTNNTNPTLFSVAPAIDATTGNLTYTAAANANGSANITVVLMDNGGTANGGVDTSAPQTFTITVTTVNDAPSFLVGPNQSVPQESPAQSVPSFATAISPGPVDEAGQTLTFNVSVTTNPGLFSVAPAIASNGTLTYTPAAGQTGTANISVTLSDNGGVLNGGVDTSGAQTFTITLEDVNEVPVPTATPASPITLPENSPAATVVTDIAPNDPDVGQTHTYTFQSGNTGNVFAVDAAGVITVVGPLNFEGADDPYTLVVRVTDNGTPTLFADISITVNLSDVNEAPAVTAGGTLAYTEGAGAVVLNNAVTVTDPDAGEGLASATVQITGNLANAEDVLAFTNTANITGVFTAATGTLALTGNDTPAAYQAALASVTYQNTSNAPSTLQRTVSWSVNDGALASNTATSTIDITTVNSAPVVTTSGGSTAYTENGPAVAIDAALTATDSDSPNAVSALVQITGGLQSGEDVLAFVNTPNITGVYFPATGELQLSGTDTFANYQIALRSVTYANTSDAPNTGARTVSFSITDNGAPGLVSNIATKTVTVAAANDAPVVTLSGSTPSFTEGGAPVVVDSGLTVSDADDINLETAAVTITNAFAGDVLTGTSGGGVTVTGSGTTALSLSGSASLAAYIAVLQGVTFNSPGDNPDPTARIVRFVANDGDVNSNLADKTVTVVAVNDAPVNTFPAAPSTNEDTALTFTGANVISVADVDVAAGSMTVTLTATQGTIDADNTGGATIGGDGTAVVTLNGTLTQINATLDGTIFNPTPNFFGAASVTVLTSDNGNTGTGGALTDSDPIAITVIAVNDAPTATVKAHTTHSAIEFEIVAASHTGELLEGAADVDDPVGDLTAVFVAGSALPAGAQVTVTNASNGSFRYDPPGGASGAGSFQFQICDDGVPTAPQQCSAATTVTFTITGPELHFVDDSAAAGGDGGLNDPFDSLADLPAGRGTGDRIYVFEGSYATAHSLNADEHLIGQGHSGSSTAHLGVVAVGNGVLDTTPAAGVAPTLGNTITFGGNNGLLRGVAISSGANTGVVAGAVTGITVLESSVTATTTAVNFNGTGAAAADVTFTSTSSSGGVNGIVLNNLTAAAGDTFNFGSGSLTGHTGVSFLGTGTLATVTYSGNITKNSAGNIVELNGVVAATDTGTVSLSGTLACNGCSGIDVVNRDTGTITFSGATKTLSTGATAAVHLDNNDSATINFTGGNLDIDTTTGAGFNAVNGATGVSVQGAVNTIDSVNGVGLNVASTAIGASDMTFQRISSGAGANVGISLDTTGGAGSLVVTGTGAASSGGVIANKTGADGSTTAGIGVYLNSTTGVELNSMQLNDFENSGIVGRSVNGFTLTGSVISGVNGTNTGVVEGALNFGLTNPGGTNGLQGTGLIRNSRFSGAIEHNLEFYNQSGAMTLTIEGLTAVSEGADPNSAADDVADCIIEENSVAGGSDGILIEMQGTATANIRVDRCLFRDNKSQPVQVAAIDSSDIILVIEESRTRRFDQGNEGAVLSNGSNADLTTRVSNNHFNGLGGTSIFVGQTPGNATPASELDATVDNNVVNQLTTATNHGIIGFMTSTVGQVSIARLNMNNNTVVNNSTSGTTRGILVDPPDVNTSPDFDATVSNNSVAVGDNINGVGGLVVQARQSSIGCMVIDANTVTFPNGTPAGINGIRARQAAPAPNPNMEQEAGCTTPPAATVLACRNPASTTEVLGTINVVAAGTCQTPVVVP